jgi:hypothetical protein
MKQSSPPETLVRFSDVGAAFSPLALRINAAGPFLGEAREKISILRSPLSSWQCQPHGCNLHQVGADLPRRRPAGVGWPASTGGFHGLRRHLQQHLAPPRRARFPCSSKRSTARGRTCSTSTFRVRSNSVADGSWPVPGTK